MAHTRTVGDNRFDLYLMYFCMLLYLSVFQTVWCTLGQLEIETFVFECCQHRENWAGAPVMKSPPSSRPRAWMRRRMGILMMCGKG